MQRGHVTVCQLSRLPSPTRPCRHGQRHGGHVEVPVDRKLPLCLSLFLWPVDHRERGEVNIVLHDGEAPELDIAAGGRLGIAREFAAEGELGPGLHARCQHQEEQRVGLHWAVAGVKGLPRVS